MIAAKVQEIKIGTEWMPKVPSHWKFIRVKNLFKEIDQRSVTGNEDLLSVSQFTGVTLRKDKFEDGKDITNAKTLKGYKIVQPGDLIINIMLAWNGSLGISDYHGITSPAYCVYRIKEDYNPYYFGYLFSTSLYKGEFKKKSTGIIESRLRLYSDEFFRIFCFVPPKGEQDKIVEHIKLESDKIETFIKAKQKFIDILKEQRLSIITNAVTKGIDESVDMKDANIEFLDYVPKHWLLKRGNWVSELGKENLSKSDIHKLENVLHYSIPAVQKNGLPAQEIGTSIDSNKQVVKEGDLLVSKLNPHKSTIILVEKNLSNLKLIASTEFVNIRCKEVNREFCYYLYQSSTVTARISSTVQSATNSHKRAYPSTIYKLWNYYPPTIKEQNQIVKFIKRETKTLDKAINEAQREIELMTEYKKAMIAEAVTGKMKI